MNEATDPFADIRPYRDDEVARVLQGLRGEPGLINTLAEWKLGPLFRVAPTLARALVKIWLGHQLKRLTTVDAVQIQLRPLLADMVAKTVRLSSDGLESLDPAESWLFVSNHRDITMDPALTNHILYDAGHRTLAIAIGDNLLKERWVADLMRLNKSFIVKRALSGPRELLAASKQLAGFIRGMITTNQGPVWIAQREGRAKDSILMTAGSVVSMPSFARPSRCAIQTGP